MNIMLKWARRAAILLLLGATVNCAIAWGGALATGWRLGSEEHDATAEQIRWWQRNAPAGFDPLPGDTLDTFDATGCSLYTFFGTSVNEDGLEMQRAYHMRAGFPLRAFEAQRWADFTPVPYGNPPTTIDRGVWIVRKSGADYLIPIEPLWLGLVFNSLLYAGVASVVVWIPGWYRRRRRAGRGLCPACAYPMGTSAVCTECGAPLPAAAAK